MANRKITYEVGFIGNTSQLQNALRQAVYSLQQLGSKPEFLQKGLEGSARAALELNNHLRNAYNQDTGKLDLTRFRQELEKSKTTLEQYAMKLRSMGPEGERAFMQVATALGAAELPLKRTNALMDKLWVTMKNTARWRLTTGVLNSFIGGLQQAFGYAKSLNASLNDIRIVSGKSAEEMAQFAKEANRAAQTLSTTTTTYTDASLIYYQQGLSDDEVKRRADATIKMANVTGQTAETISQQMTAVWNNFYDGTRSLESFEDTMVALGVSTATSSKEIAEGLEKFAPVANTVGLSFDYAAAALATITATTRESASVAGNALKTLFSRLEGLKLGETLDDGTDLNKYSKALETVGINIKDVSGELKNMDTILDELGAKWQLLARDEQMALAETVGGVRQYAQLVALMDNWTFFQENLATARSSEGSLEKQAAIYAESWEAARDRVKAATEDVYDSLINPKVFIDLDKMAQAVLKPLASILDSVGGLTGLLPVAAALMTKVYSSQIANVIRDMAVNIGLMTGREQERARAIQAESAALVERLSLSNQDQSTESTRIDILRTQIGLQGEINARADQYNEQQLSHIKNETYIIELLKQQALRQADLVDKSRQAFVEQSDTIYSLLAKPNFGSNEAATQEFARWFVDGFSKNALPLFTDSLYELVSFNGSINKAFSGLESGLEKIAQKSVYIEKLRGALGEVNKDSGNWRQTIQELAVSAGLWTDSTKITDEALNQLRNDVSITGKVAQETDKDMQHFQEVLVKLGAVDPSSVTRYIAAMKELQRTAIDNNWSTEQYKKAVADLTKEMQTGMSATMDWADTLVAIANGASRAAMAIRSFENIIEVFSDDSLDGVEKFTRVLTSLSMLIPTLTAIIGVFGKGALKVGTDVATAGVTAGTGIATGAAIAKAAMPIITAIIVGIYAIIKVADALYTSQKEAQEAIKKSIEEYKKVKQELDDLQDKLTTTQDRIKELQELTKNGSISIVEQDELKRLQQENDELERQIALEERLAKIQFESAVREIEKNVNKIYKIQDYDYSDYPDVESELGKNRELLRQDLYKRIDSNQTYKENDVNSLYTSLAQIWENQYNWSLNRALSEVSVIKQHFSKEDQEAIDLYIKSLYKEVSVAQENAYNQYLANNKDIYSRVEEDYSTFIEAIKLGVRSVDDLEFVTLSKELTKLRHIFYPDNIEYEETFLDPVLRQLSNKDLNALFNNNFEGLSKNGNNLLLQYGVSANEVANRVSKIGEQATKELAKFGLSTEGFSFAALKLIVEKEDGFESVEQLLNWLYKQSGIIPVSLQVEAIEDARTEALTTLASGELLGEELITKLQEAYAGIRDMSNFANLSVKDQLDFLSNEGKVVQEQIDALEKERKALDAKKDEDLGIDSQVIQWKINQIDKELEELRDKYTKDPWKIELEIDNTIAAQLNNAKKAFSLIGDDLIVTSTELEELAKRYPETLTNATYDASENVIKINQETYDYLKGQIEGTLDTERDVAAQRLLLSTQLGESLIDINEFTETNKRNDNLKTITQALLGNEELTQSVQDMALQTLTAVVKAEADKRKANMDTLAAEVAGAATATDNINENAKINVENQAEAAQEILRIFDDLFRQIANGYERALSGNYTGIFHNFTSRYKGKSGASYNDTYNKNLNDVLNSLTYKNEENAYNFSNALYQALVKYGNTKNSEDWQAVQDIFHSKDYDLRTVFPDLYQDIIPGIETSFEYGTNLFGQEITDLIDNGISINFNDETSINDFLYKLSQAINDDENFGASWRDALQERYATLARLLEGEEASDKTKSGKADYAKLDNADLEKHEDLLEDIEDRYHEITREIERQNRILDQLETQAERTYGLDRLKLYEKELKELNGLYERQVAKSGRAERYLAEVDKPRLQTAFQAIQTKKGAGEILSRYGFSGFSNIEVDLNKPGQEIKDYEALEDKIRQDTENFLVGYRAFMTEYDAFLQEYNVLTDKEKAERQAEAVLLQQEYELVTAQLELVEAQQEERLAAIKQYEETLDTINTLAQEMDDTARRIEDTKLKEVSYRMEVILDVREARKQIRDFTKEIAQSFGDALTHGAEEAKLGWEQAKDEMAMYKEYVQEYNDLKALLDNANEYTDTTAIIDELKNLEGNIIESGQRLLEWADYVENMFVEALSAASERFKRFTDQLAHDTDILGTIKELYALQGITYKVESGFAQLMRTAEGQYQGYLRQAQLNKEWYEDRAAQLAQAEVALQGVLETDIRYDTLKKNRDALLAEANEAQQAMLDNAKSAMEVAKQMYLDQIEKMAYELEKKITGGSGFDLLQDKYDHYLEENDRYLDNIEESLETSIWYTRLQQDIDKTGNNAYKERLKRLQEEVDLRREGNTLSKYDLDILEAKYKVLQAQAALEDAQNNKSKVRLVRDSNGNWNYQFTADQNDIGTQEEELLKAKQNEYEITKQRYKDLNDEMIRMAEEFAEKDRQIREDMANGILTEEEGQARLAELKRYYEEKANYLSIELNIAKRDMTEAAITSATLSAGLTESVYNSSNELVQTIVNTFKNTHSPQLLSAASTTLSELQIALGAHIGEFTDASDEIKASIAKIIGTETSDGQDINGLVQRLNTSVPEIADKLAGWKDTFSNAVDPITIALQSIIEGGDIEGISANQLPQYLQDIAEGTLYDVLMGDGDNSYSGLAHGVANNFTEQFDSIIGVIEENFIPAIEEHMPEAAKAFEDFTQKIENTAEAIGIEPNNLSDMTNELTEDIQRMYDEGYEAINMMEQSLWAVYDLQAGYLDLAASVWDYIYALQALAANQVVPTIESASGVDTFGEVSTEKEKLPYTGDLSQKMAAALYNEDSGSYATFQNQRQAAEDKFGTDIVGSTDAIDQKLKNMTDDQLERIATGIEYIDTTLTKENAQDVYDFTGSPTIHIASGATGMYTGEFDGGKLGILHEKELLLNAEDTQNILSAVSAVRGMSDVLFGGIADRLDSDGLAAMAMLGSRIGGISLPGPADNSLEQHVIIESVSFPGVTSSREIEEAFENLVNDAAQWARRRKS